MNQTHTRSGRRTLLMSLLMSAPGPLIIGLGLLSGRSSTQIADFIRRSAELLAIAMAFLTYRLTTGSGVDADRRARVERLSNAFVGAMMGIGGAFMVLMALLPAAADKGNVIPGLVIALLGVVANTIFWRRYARLHKKEPNAILAVQARLYRAKSLVDGCVTAALLAVAIAPRAPLSAQLDRVGSLAVAVYLIWCGLRTLYEALQRKENAPAQPR